jgi:glycosyltransferase involved in cell wall biosynthesis
MQTSTKRKMIYIGWFLLFFGALRLLVAFVNWATQPYLPRKSHIKNRPFVSILIPARNEEKNIEKLLSDLSTFDYESLEIIVLNDNSTDSTALVVNNNIEKNHKIILVQGNELENGWLGKNFACHQLALIAKGEILLFLDADVRVANGLLEQSIAFTQKHKIKLLSIFPKQLMPSKNTRLAIPLMNWILLSLLPLILVRISGWKSFSAANGQFMFFDAQIYRQLLPHQLFKDNKVEDIAILRYFKKQKLKVATLLGDEKIQCIMYNTLQEAINGFSKNVFQFFGGSMLTSILFATITTLAPLYLLLFNGLAECITYLAAINLIRVFISLVSKQSVLSNIFLSASQQVTFIRIIQRAIINQRNKTLLWKDRNIL